MFWKWLLQYPVLKKLKRREVLSANSFLALLIFTLGCNKTSPVNTVSICLFFMIRVCNVHWCSSLWNAFHFIATMHQGQCTLETSVYVASAFRRSSAVWYYLSLGTPVLPVNKSLFMSNIRVYLFVAQDCVFQRSQEPKGCKIGSKYQSLKIGEMFQ